MNRQAIITVDPACPDGCPVHVQYDEDGRTWDHGYTGFDDPDLIKELREWLTPKH